MPGGRADNSGILIRFPALNASNPGGDWQVASDRGYEIQIEDVAICEIVQKNLHSRSYQRGRYSIKQEKGVHAFHRMYAQAMSGD